MTFATRRKNGFSLVELLIVLAVMAALISTITPVAMNAIKKAKATQVAQNLKTLSSALQHAAYLNGANSDGLIKSHGNTTIKLSDLGRDLPKDADGDDLYGFAYTRTSGGTYYAVVYYTGGDVDLATAGEILGNQSLEYTSTDLDADDSLVEDGATYQSSANDVYYYFYFTIY